MALSVSEINRIARLARLDLSPDEGRLYADQLSRVVDYIDQIARFEEGLEESCPDSSPSARLEVPRPDAAGATLDVADFLRNAPAALDRFLVVPQVK
jgi:aspartyl-tRNA(Asn)/glutamyl-tRNA(Gln) amidotransferase subunit C